MKTARRSGRESDPFTGGSSTASLEKIVSENNLFSTYIDVKKLSDRRGVSNGSIHVGNLNPHLHLLRGTLDLRNQAAGSKKKKKRRGGNMNGRKKKKRRRWWRRRKWSKKKKRRGGDTNGEEEEEEVVAATQVKVARKKKKNGDDDAVTVMSKERGIKVLGSNWLWIPYTFS
ncbi:hypothetical protein PIB30_080234 [Stylosanthes scabra]|uniref:Uncharacterized protein n=1 Tax=Stylosanthes scabra TaxID=79078 RepID=A0ABU6VSJ9_9FABA|nr:hypothetical protein [Stylosanthes scabra]